MEDRRGIRFSIINKAGLAHVVGPLGTGAARKKAAKINHKVGVPSVDQVAFVYTD